MTANILKMNEFREIKIIDMLRKEKSTWDAELTINGIPYKLMDFKIVNAKREQLEIYYLGIVHEPKENGEAKCMFCGQQMKNPECPKINQEIKKLFFEKVVPQIEEDIGFTELILSDIEEGKTLEQYRDKNKKVEIKAAGISKKSEMLFIVNYNGEKVMLKEYLGEGAEYTVPSIFYYNEEKQALYVHLEYMFPEHMANLLLEMNDFLLKEDEEKIIYDIEGLTEMDFWQYVKEKEGEE